MKNIFFMVMTLFCAVVMMASAAAGQDVRPVLERDYFVQPVPFNLVEVEDDFWSPRLETNRIVTIPYAFEKCVETDRISNFEKAAGLKSGKHIGAAFNDSDVYKIMEGAAYSLQVNPDRMMRLYLDQLIAVIAGAQWEDGYLFTHYSVPERQYEKLWANIRWVHEQYCMGHMNEAAVAHYQVTGDSAFLDVAKKNADLICATFGPGKRTDPPGHQEIEIGLCRLYRVTGDEKYLEQAKFFLDQRGRRGNRGPHGNGGLYGEYSQDHKPVVEQTRGVGHSVRAAYLYTGMADVAALTGNMDYVKAINDIWQDVVGKKLYVTGGIGASGGHEGFAEPYVLPNMTAYCETCASIANIMWNHRMFLMYGDAGYIDVLERTLYNATLSGISMKGDRFFYPNPLESIGQHERQAWFGCACCPSNVARFIPSVPGYAYAYKNSDVYVNLFIGGETTIGTATNKVQLKQTTDFPWQGKVDIDVTPAKSERFRMLVRIPGWARNEAGPLDLYHFLKEVDDEPVLKVNGTKVDVRLSDGYAIIDRTWKKGDSIQLELPMPVRRVIAHENVKADRGKVALQRGPIVFCLEWPDNDGQVLNMVIPDEAAIAAQKRPDLLNGVVTLTGQAQVYRRTVAGEVVQDLTRKFTAIPYYAWAHRGRGQMTVWPARTGEAARPEPAKTLTYIAEVSASYVHASLSAIKDQVLPTSSSDAGAQHLDFWPHNGGTEWVKFAWDEPHAISGVRVYWFDDSGHGGCKVPESWKVLYHSGNDQWQAVDNTTPYMTQKDAFNMVRFQTIKTDAIKIVVYQQEGWSSGIQEVEIEEAE